MFAILFAETGELIQDGFLTEDSALLWLNKACETGLLIPNDVTEYTIELREK